MPARKKPVENRKPSNPVRLLFSIVMPRLNKAPNKAQVKNTLEGENRSAIVKSAKTKVPEINPNCTAEVKCPKALSDKSNVVAKSFITLFPANHKEVQQNWEMTIMGKIHRDLDIQFFS